MADPDAQLRMWPAVQEFIAEAEAEATARERQRIREAVERACWQKYVIPEWLINILGETDDAC